MLENGPSEAAQKGWLRCGRTHVVNDAGYAGAGASDQASRYRRRRRGTSRRLTTMRFSE